MASAAVDRILGLLTNVKLTSSGWTALCPAHDDRTSSLSIREGDDGRVLLRCFAGCETSQVVRALGLQMRDLFTFQQESEVRRGESNHADAPLTIESLAHDKGLPAEFLRGLGLQDRSDGVLVSYKLMDGSPAPRQRLRTALKAREGSSWLPGKGSIVPYGLWRLGEARMAGHLTLVEGESDCWTTWLNCFPALGMPGATTFGLLQPAYLEGIGRLYLFREPDQGGGKLVSGLTKRLREMKWPGSALLVTPPAGIKDLNDLHKRDPAAFKAAFQKLLQEAKPLDISDGSHQPVLVCMADVEPVPVKWLWQPYVPLGKLTILEGDPGIGKTQAAIASSAAVSRGTPLPSPDGPQAPHREPAPVIYMTAEDGLADTIRPRLDAAEADVHRIHCLQAKKVRSSKGETSLRGITLADIEVIEKALASVRPLLLVVDPLQAFLGSDVDMYRPNETRPLLAALARLAEKYACAVLLIRHLTKDERTKPLYRGMGSIDITAAARSVLLAGQDPRDTNHRALIHVKSSLAKMGASIGFEIQENRFVWTGTSDLTAASVMASLDTPEQRSEVDEAVEFLHTALAKGPRLAAEVQREAQKAGVSEATLRRAKFVAVVHSRRRSEISASRGHGGWEWFLADRSGRSAPHAPTDDHLEDLAEPVEKTEVIADVQDDHVITLNDQAKPTESEEVTVTVQDDHREGQGAVTGDSGDDDSELF